MSGGAPIGRLFHVGHAAPALGPLDDWYDRVVVPRRGVMDGHQSADEGRAASLLVVGDAMIETMAPLGGRATSPVGRFVARFGAHWHSLAWYTSDVGDVWDRLRGHGVRVVSSGGAPGGGTGRRPADGAVYTHPRDTTTQLEFYQPPDGRLGPQGPAPLADPRLGASWAREWRSGANPLGIVRLAYVTLVTADVARARTLFSDVLGGRTLLESSSGTAGTRNTYVLVGSGTVLELAQPVARSSLAAADVAAHGQACHAVAFEVAGLERTARHLAACGIRLVGRDEETLFADPRDTWGAPLRFTTRRIAGEPGPGPPVGSRP